LTVGRREKMSRLKERARSLHHRVKHLEEENRALRVAVGLDGAQIQDQATVKRVKHGKAVDLPSGNLAFPLPKGWIFDHGPIEWNTKDGQTYVKVPIIKTEV